MEKLDRHLAKYWEKILLMEAQYFVKSKEKM